jgi:serine/threonine protein kinase/WD40 repeat protein
MTPWPSSESPEVSLADLKWIDEICERFEAAWTADATPALREFLVDAPEAVRRRLFAELFQAELALRHDRGRQLDLVLYRQQFPEFEDDLLTIFAAFSANPPGPNQRGDTTLLRGPKHAPRPATATAGVLVPGYEILRELGRGGMGVVYLGRHLRLQRQVALKLILAGPHVDAETLARFDAEARTVAQLSHPNIVQIFEVGEHERRPYFALEYVEGGSLADHLGAAPQPPRAAAQLLETVARAMHFAHAQGIVHRDLKPANILLASEEGAQTAKPQAAEKTGTPTHHSPLTTHQPKVTDFGLAKIIGPGAAAVPDLRTRTGMVVGTPCYMAPEQARSGALPLGPAADVYALGVILYEMLTGRPPFLAANVFDTLEQVCFQEPVPPRQLQGRTPRDLETICLKCLRKEPQQRYLTAQALADDLRRWLDGRPILARPVGPLARAARWCRRNPVVAVLTATVILAVLLGSGFSVWFGVQATLNADKLLVKTGELETKTGELEKTAVRLADEKTRAEDATREANQRKQEVEAQLTRYQWLDYASRLDKAYRYLKGEQRDLALPILAACPWDFRHWEHTLLLHLAVGGPAKTHLFPDLSSYWDFSPDTRWLAGGDLVGDLRVWDLDRGELIRMVGRHPGANSVGISPDGRLLASGAPTGPVKLWDVQAGKVVASLSERDQPERNCRALGFTADGRQLVAVLSGLGEAEAKLEVIVWDVTSHQEVRTVPLPVPGWPRVVVLGPGGRVLTAHENREATRRAIHVWDIATGVQVQSFADRWCFDGLSFSPDGKLVAVGDGTVLDVSTGQPRFQLRGQTEDAVSTAFSPDGKRLFGTTTGGALHVWDLTVFGHHLLHVQVPARTWRVAVSRDGRRLVSVSLRVEKKAVEVAVWDRLSSERDRKRAEPDLLRIDTVPVPLAAAVFTPDGKRLLTGSASPGQAGLVRAWDAMTGQPLGTWGQHQDRVTGLAVSGDGRTVVSCGSEKWPRQPGAARLAPGEVKVWDAVTGRCVRTLREHAGAVWAVAVTGDGRLIASGSEDRTVKLYDGTTGKVVRTLEGHALAVQSVAFSADGKYLASGSGELGRPVDEARLVPEAKDYVGELRVWETATGRLVQAIPMPGVIVNGVSLSPDGLAVAAGFGRWTNDPKGFYNGGVKVWEVKTGQVRWSQDFNYAATSVAYSPDGRRLATGTRRVNEAAVAVWDVVSGKQVQGLFPPRSVLSVAFDGAGTRLVFTEGFGATIWGIPVEEAPAPGWHHR